MTRPRWEWVLDGVEDSAPATPVFTSQFEAEEWIGGHWRDLAATGAVAARLHHEGVQVTPTVEIPAP